MPTKEQLKLRIERIDDYVEQLRGKQIEIKKIPANYKIDVLAKALIERIVDPSDVSPRLAQQVSITMLKGSPWRERDEAATKGSDVHDLADRLSQGEVVEIPEHLRDHVRSWQAWCSDWDMTFVSTEFSVYSVTYSYAGTADFIGYSGTHPEFGLILGDYKTSKSGIWPDIALQLSAIRYADFVGNHDLTEDHTALNQIDSCIGVQITAGGYQVVPVRISKATFDVFLSAINIAAWKQDYEQFALEPMAFVNVPKEDQ